MATAVLVGIFALLLKEGWPALRAVGLRQFFAHVLWRPDGYTNQTFGLWPAIEGTFLTTFLALIISVPLGIGTSCYLSFLASQWLREWLKPSFELMATIPSVVIGFIGLVVTGPLIAKLTHRTNGLNALNGSILLALMSLPTIISVSEDALQSISRDVWRGSLALGATRFRTIMSVMIPAARGGIFAAVMLGMGRAVGETMTVLMATGNAGQFPSGLFSSVKTLTATIAIELGEVSFTSTHFHALFVVGAVLFVITFIINLLGELVVGGWR
jgi:phosphate transport system permease protein